MNPQLPLLLFVLIGFVSGVASGLFGIGGGVLIVPGLVYLVGLSQHRATGTSLAVLLPPIGLAAVVEYYRHGNVDLRAAVIMAGTLFVGAWVGAVYANRLSGPYLRLAFGVFIVVLGLSLIVGAMRRLGWI
ncbi:MAG TPA: permease [Deltaproteobacteria bacterium]|nr:permease [Deltaproteobacteria bacterium]